MQEVIGKSPRSGGACRMAHENRSVGVVSGVLSTAWATLGVASDFDPQAVSDGVRPGK